jgi:hypothetical protein
MAICSKCGLEFATNDLSGREPCPGCGATVRRMERRAEDTFAHSDHLMLELRRDSRFIGFRESERDGCAGSADDDNGSIKMSLVGLSPQGEADTLAVSRTLVRRLGEPWGEPVAGPEHSDIDAISTSTADRKSQLHIQVVRANVSADWWRFLAKHGSNTTFGNADEFAGALLLAARKKADRTPPARRAKLILAIDANRLSAFSLDSVIIRVSEKHAEPCPRSVSRASGSWAHLVLVLISWLRLRNTTRTGQRDFRPGQITLANSFSTPWRPSRYSPATRS